jgi:DNA-binding transcriptional ArsR family regulator
MIRKKSPLLPDEDLAELTSLFRILSDKTRLSIVLILSHGQRNVTSLCNELSLPQPTVSHHLGLLRMNDIVTARRQGKQVFYGLTSGGTSEDDVMHVNLARHVLRVIDRVPAA